MRSKRRKFDKPVIIGLTGGPGVGKTEVTKILTKRGVKVISADAIGHKLLANDKRVWKKLISLFGNDVLTKDGAFDRQKIGMIVFNDFEKLAEFNKIIHPPLLKQLRRELLSLKRERKNRLIVVDAALIFEWGIAHWFDLILVVDVPKQERIDRICQTGLSRYQAQRRIASQMPHKDKVALADYVINNDKGRKSLEKNVNKFITEMRNYSV
jgi:dephospho-CoA kinase